MKTTLILLLFAFINSERLEEIRKSCATPKTVYVLNDDYWTTEPLELRVNPGLNASDWEKLISLTCERTYQPLSIRMRRKTNSVELSEYYRTHFHESELENESKRLNGLLNQRLQDLWKQSNFRLQFLKDSKWVKNGTVPIEAVSSILKLSSPSFSIGCNNDKINLRIAVNSVDMHIVSKCEDIGEDYNNTYQFYNISPSWMYQISNQTYSINETLCQKGSDFLVCPKTAIKSEECSVHSIENCTKRTIEKDPNAISTSFVRQLSGGIAAYGTFEKILDLHENRKSTVNETIDHGLYYFSYTEL
ncbi:unnamed protein product [Caenorhabditis nigoni]